MVLSIIGLIIGVGGFFVGYWTSMEILKKQLIHTQEQNRNKLKSLVRILAIELKQNYDVLFVGQNQFYCANPLALLSNFKDFDFSNKEAMWSMLMESEAFVKNMEAFQAINNITRYLKVLNKHAEVMKPHKDSLSETCIDMQNFKRTMDEIRVFYGGGRFEENKVYEQTKLHLQLNQLIESI